MLFKFGWIDVIFHRLFHTFDSTGIWYKDKIISLVLSSIHRLIQKCFGMMSFIPNHIILEAERFLSCSGNEWSEKLLVQFYPKFKFSWMVHNEQFFSAVKPKPWLNNYQKQKFKRYSTHFLIRDFKTGSFFLNLKTEWAQLTHLTTRVKLQKPLTHGTLPKTVTLNSW